MTADNSIHDAVCFFCSVRAEGEVSGDIVVFFGNIRLAGEAHHDVVNFFGNITAADNTTIARRHGELFRRGAAGRERDRAARTWWRCSVCCTRRLRSSVGRDRVMQPAWVITFPPLVLVLIIFLIIHEYRVVPQTAIDARLSVSSASLALAAQELLESCTLNP